MVEARLFQALSDPTRLRILALLAREPINVSGMVEQLGCAQPAVSRHLRILRDVALIRDRRMGKEVEYSLNHDQLAQAAGYLEGLLTNADVGTLRTPPLTQPRSGATEGAPRKAAKSARKVAPVPAPPAKAKPRQVRTKAGPAGAKPRKVKGESGPARRKAPPDREPAFVIERDADGMDDFLL